MAVVPQPNPTTYTEGICTGYTAVSEIFTFNVEPNCSRSANDHRQLMFLNRYGHWDYYTFLFERNEGIGITRETYKSWNTDWGSSNPIKTQYSRGLTDSDVDMSLTVVVNSGFINQPDFMYLEELYTSNDVYEIQADGGIYPVNIVNTEFVRKIKGNRTIYNLELTYVYANNIQLLHK
jgi:hypothetical protein